MPESFTVEAAREFGEALSGCYLKGIKPRKKVKSLLKRFKKIIFANRIYVDLITQTK